MKPLFIGITGGIAAGKSAVVARLRQHGLTVSDCDALAHRATAPGSHCLALIREAIGAEVFDSKGQLNRRALGEIVFQDVRKRRLLEEIIHPFVRRSMLDERDAAYARGERVVFGDVPLLYEVGWQDVFDAVGLVVCDDSTRVSRIAARDGLPAEQALARIQAQLPQSEKISLAMVIIENNSDMCALQEKVDLLLRERNLLIN